MRLASTPGRSPRCKQTPEVDHLLGPGQAALLQGTRETLPHRLDAAAAGCLGRIQTLVLAEYEFSNLLAVTDFQIGPT